MLKGMTDKPCPFAAGSLTGQGVRILAGALFCAAGQTEEAWGTRGQSSLHSHVGPALERGLQQMQMHNLSSLRMSQSRLWEGAGHGDEHCSHL